MDQFSSKPSVSLEKSIDTSTALVETNPADIDRVYELEKCFEWITENNYKKVSPNRSLLSQFILLHLPYLGMSTIPRLSPTRFIGDSQSFTETARTSRLYHGRFGLRKVHIHSRISIYIF